ncbi:MAG TPA: ClbS/DfsB family four-helix bundle protein [Anaerolineales bacterium]|nr:ClbS/DfsB family four-helix bundle protein [Anaerolineales bacterium]
MAEQPLPQSLDVLLASIEREWNALIEVVNRLAPEQMIRPDSGGWSPKDHLAHLATWMNYMRRSYLGGEPSHTALGIDPQKLKGLDEDGINAIIFERNRGRSADDIRAELKNAYREAIRTLTTMKFSDLMKPFKEDDPKKRPVILWVLGNTSEHFAEHRAYMERALNTRDP